jgi:glutamate racemase
MIGIFDSGIGGLTVAREIRKKIPSADILYFGDVARMPYGNKSPETVTEYSREIVRYLIGRGAETIVIACNTASAVAAAKLRREFSVPIFDVIAPAVSEALRPMGRAPRADRRIAVLGTRGTVGSGAYQKALAAASKKVKVMALACPIFVPLVEEGYAGTAEGAEIVKHTLRPLVSRKPETLILGCTHYPLLRKEIRAVFPKARLVDSSAVALDLRRDLFQPMSRLGRGGKKTGRIEIVVTDLTPHFLRFARKIIGSAAKIKKIGVERLNK